MKRCFILLGVSLGVWLAACNDRPTGPARTWTATLTGVVLDSAGNRIPSASVTMRGVWLIGGSSDTVGRCSGSSLSELTTQADLNGDYSIAVHGGPFPLDVCLVVDATVLWRGVQLTGSTEVDSVRLGPTGLFDLQVLVKVKDAGKRG